MSRFAPKHKRQVRPADVSPLFKPPFWHSKTALTSLRGPFAALETSQEAPKSIRVVLATARKRPRLPQDAPEAAPESLKMHPGPPLQLENHIQTRQDVINKILCY